MPGMLWKNAAQKSCASPWRKELGHESKPDLQAMLSRASAIAIAQKCCAAAGLKHWKRSSKSLRRQRLGTK
jgi:hypothetical protein